MRDALLHHTELLIRALHTHFFIIIYLWDILRTENRTVLRKIYEAFMIYSCNPSINDKEEFTILERFLIKWWHFNFILRSDFQFLIYIWDFNLFSTFYISSCVQYFLFVWIILFVGQIFQFLLLTFIRFYHIVLFLISRPDSITTSFIFVWFTFSLPPSTAVFYNFG